MSDPQQPHETSPAPAPPPEGADAPGEPAAPSTPPSADLGPGVDAEPPVEAVAAEHAPAEHAATEHASAEATGGAPASASTETAGEGESEGDGEEGGDEAGEPSTPGAEAAPGADGAPGDPTKKKRRRRRKKKSSAGGEAAPGTEGAPGGEAIAGAEGAAPQQQRAPRAPRPPKRDTSHAPFVRFIDHTSIAARRHLFAVGEVVAGRVRSVADGVITLDLFGKGTAFVDETEQREIAPLPEKHEHTASGDLAAPDGSADAVEGDPADVDAHVDGADDAHVDEGHADAHVDEGHADAHVDEGHADAAGDAEGAHAEAPAEGATAEGGVELRASSDIAAHEAHAAGDEGAAERPSPEPPPVDLSHDEREAAAEAAHAAELAAAPPAPPPPAVGSIFRGRIAAIAESGTLALMNRPRDGKAARARVDEARDKHQRVLGIVYGFNRGGFDVFIDGLRAFCPASGMSLWAIDDPHTLIGKKQPFSIPPTKQGQHGLVVSRRAILEREARKDARDRIKALGIGSRIRGRVTQVRDFGLFVDLGGGLEGMVHVSELGWDRVARPGDVVKVGDEIETQILKIPDGRKERHERIGLSLRAALPDPWDQHAELVAEGRAFKGKVVRVAEFGAFVEVAPGIDGLLHVTELGQKLAHAKEAVKEGDEVPVVIERADRKARRLSLSKLSPADAKALEAGTLAPVEAVKRPKPGTHLKVKVERVEHHGVFVQLVGIVGKRGRGYIPNNEMATERGTDHRKLFPVGKEIDVKVIGEDRDGSLKLSRKGFMFDEEKRAVSEYRKEASKQGFGTFGDLLRAKIGGAGGDAPKT